MIHNIYARLAFQRFPTPIDAACSARYCCQWRWIPSFLLVAPRSWSALFGQRRVGPQPTPKFQIIFFAMQASGPSPEAQADALLLHFLSPLSDSDTPSWSDALSQAVKERRGLAVGGQLLVDRLLQEAGVSSSLFPPSSPSDAFVLMVEVLTSAAPDLLKSELMYYLGLEHNHIQATQHASAMAEYLHLPASNCTEVESYWAIDHGFFDRAVAGGRTSKFSSIMAESLSSSPALLLEFYEVRGALPSIESSNDAASFHELSMIVAALARVEGLVSAWLMCRTILAAQPTDYAPSVRLHLFGTLLRLCFSPPDATLIRDLLNLPLKTDEEAFIESFAIDSLDQSHGALAMDTLLIKCVNQGRYIDAIHLDHRASRHERTLALSGQENEFYLRAKQRRSAFMDGVWAVIPVIQRDALHAQDVKEDISSEATHTNDVNMDIASSPPLRPHTPMSASLNSKDMQRTHPFSPEVNLLRASIRVPTASSSETRSASPAQKLTDQSAELRSSSPFSGWKQPGVLRQTHVSPKPAWSLPVPRIMRTSKSYDLNVDIPVSTIDSNVQDNAKSDDADTDILKDTPVLESNATEENDAVLDSPREVPVRRRTGQRRSARQATKAIRKVMKPSDVKPEPTIPGGFPMEEEEATVNPSPRRSTRRSRMNVASKTVNEMSTSLSMHPDTPSKSPSTTSRIPRSSTTADITMYPQNSLARLEALSDVQPIARRTRAQVAELESQGSQSSTDAISDTEAESNVLSTPSRRRTRSERASAAALSSPQRVTRSARRLRDGSAGTPRTPGRSSRRH